MLYSTSHQLKQPKFDNSNQYATTSFVQDALGSFSSATAITALSTTLTAAQIGGSFLFSTAGATVALPTPSGVPAGSAYKLHTSLGFTLSVTGGANIQAGSSLVTSLSVPAGTEVLAVSSGSIWWVFGTALIPSSVGVGQTWQDLTASRALNTTYTNTTGKTIAISVSLNASGTGAALSITVNGINISRGTFNYNSTAPTSNNALIPSGATYSVALYAGSGTITNWAELR